MSPFPVRLVPWGGIRKPSSYYGGVGRFSGRVIHPVWIPFQGSRHIYLLAVVSWDLLALVSQRAVQNHVHVDHCGKSIGDLARAGLLAPGTGTRS